MNIDRLLERLKQIEETSLTSLDRWAEVDPIAGIERAGEVLRASLLLKKIKRLRSMAAMDDGPNRICRWYTSQATGMIEYRPWEQNTTSPIQNLINTQSATTTAWLLDQLSTFVDLVAVDPESRGLTDDERTFCKAAAVRAGMQTATLITIIERLTSETLVPADEVEG